MGVFVSYVRTDERLVRMLHGQLEDMKHTVFFDQDMVGGQDWWDVILDEIRKCIVFLYVLSPDSVGSRACQAELGYAVALGKPLIGVMIREVPIEKAPDALQRTNIQNLVYPDMQAWFNLDEAVDKFEQSESAGEVPDVLPEPPPAPIADLSSARSILNSPTLGTDDQREVAADLGKRVVDPDERKAVVALLEKLRDHNEVLADIKEEAADLVEKYREQRLDARSAGLLRGVVEDFRNQECTPILGSGLTDWLFGSRRDLAHQWAQKHQFPMGQSRRGDLPQVAQFVAVRQTERKVRSGLGTFYRDQLKRRFPKIVGETEEAPLDRMIVDVWKAKSPSELAEPHVVLANLGCPIYITTQPTTLLSEALIDAGRKPVIDFCRWNLEVDSWPSSPLAENPDYVPTPDSPLVYHVFGVLNAPDSIVITEDDYFDFLAAVASNSSLIPTMVLDKMVFSSLLFMGFGPEDWDMRVLLRSLLNRETARKRSDYKHVAAVMNQQKVESPREARSYVENYFESFRQPPIHVFWSSLGEFCVALKKAWESAE